MDWRTFWNEDHSIYVNARHRAVHAALVARGIAELLPNHAAHVLDWGCGEAQAADIVAERCATLFLYDSAPRVRDGLRRRYDGRGKFSVIDKAGLHALPIASLDAVVIVSVVQYLSPQAFADVLSSLVPKLAPVGRLIVADIIPPDLSSVWDAWALMQLAWRGGFVVAALVGLVRTLFSNYSRLRSQLGITRWSETEMIAILSAHGLSARRVERNIGHNQARMTFIATLTS